MIQVLTGTDADLLSHCARRTADRDTVVLAPDLAWVEPWAVVRRLLPVLRKRLGNETVERAVERHPVAASFVLPGLRETLDATAALRRRRLAARLSSHMTHNEIVQEQLFEEVACFFHDLVPSELQLVLPNIARLDPSSLVLLRTVVRLFPRSSPSLVVGYDPATTAELDADGILWDFSPLMVKAFVHGFHHLPGFRVDRVPEAHRAPGEASPEKPAQSPDPRVDALDCDLEGRAWRALQRVPNQPGAPVPEATLDLVLAAIDACFESYAFRSLMILGREILRRNASLTAGDESRVRTMLALSAHNRQFLSRGNLALARFLEGHYRRALELESDPLRTICLLYRLAVAVGRRQGRIEPALAYADRGLEMLATAELPAEEAAMQEAWLHNIRAFLLMRQEQIPAAFEEERQAVALLARCEELSEILRTDARLSRAVVADNLAELAILVQDDQSRARWHRATQELVGDWLDLEHLTSRMWMNFHRARLQLVEASRHAQVGVRESRRQNIYVLEYLYLVHLADFQYRLGHPRRASALYDEALKFRDLLADGVDVRVRVEAGRLAAALRLGSFSVAKAELRKLVADLGAPSPAESAVLEATAGWIAAQAGEAEDAERQVNRAIDLAVEGGVRDSLLRVALLAARTCRVLGRDEEARSAYLQALEISEAGDGSDRVAAADLAEVQLGLWSCDGRREALPAAVRCYPDALREDPEAWWRLGELLDGLRAANEEGDGWLESPELAPALAAIHRAARQRPDCRERLAAVESVFPEVEGDGRASAEEEPEAPAPATAASAGSVSAP